MRISKREPEKRNFSILTLDDDQIMISTIQAYFERSGYNVDTEHEPYKAIERIRNGSYDILLLDFLMMPICGDEVVREVRKFNKEIFIILLTGHKSVAPPIKTIRELDIQGYFEKNEKFDQLELLVESCAKSILQMRTIQDYKKGLSTMIDGMPNMFHLQTENDIGKYIINTADNLVTNNGICLEYNPLYYQGKSSNHILSSNQTCRPEYRLADLECTSIEVVKDWVIVPILSKNNDKIAVLSIKKRKSLTETELQLLHMFKDHITVAINNMSLHIELNEKNNELTNAYSRLNDGYMEIVDALRSLVDARDVYTCGHSDRVSKGAYLIAKKISNSINFQEKCKIAGLFHDIGKIGVPDSVLLKTEHLDSEEYNIIKKHPEEGARILSSMSIFKDIIASIRGHHEKYDGTGYPDGLAGTDIPIISRIISVVDSYDAMMSNRVYRDSYSYDKALSELKGCSNTQFDPVIVNCFLELLEEHGPNILL